MQGPIGLIFSISFPVSGNSGFTLPWNAAISPAPNPYTSALTAATNSAGSLLPTTYLNPQSFQIISSGADGLYGVGGQYLSNVTGESLPYDSRATMHISTRRPGPPESRAGQHHQLP